GFIGVTCPFYEVCGFRQSRDRQVNRAKELLTGDGTTPTARLVVWAADKPVLRVADQYLLGAVMVRRRVAQGDATFFLGRMTDPGGWNYFPLVYLIKEPLAWW